MIDQTNSTRPDHACGPRASISRVATRPATVDARPGFTLIEMMVVLLILVIMTSIMIPVMSSASDTRRAREGARVLNTMLASAQTQAQVSGRPSAVWIQRLTNSAGGAVNPASAIDLYLADVPPPYLGDSLASTAQIDLKSATPNPSTASVTFASTNLTNAGVNTGDLIRFEYRGEEFVLSNIHSNSGNDTSTATIAPLDSTLSGTSQAFPPNGNSLASPATIGPGMQFQILRRPVKSMASAVQLSDGVAIDLAWSGADPNWALSTTAVGPIATNIQKDWWPTTTNQNQTVSGPTWFAKPFFVPWSHSPLDAAVATYLNPNVSGFFPTNPFDTGAIIITFNSSGALDLVYSLSIVPNPSSPTPAPIQSVLVARPYSGVYLLVGRVENIPLAVEGTSPTVSPQPATTNMAAPNLFDGNSRWVAINRNGLVTTTEAAYTPNTSTTPVTSSLRLARGSQNSVGN